MTSTFLNTVITFLSKAVQVSYSYCDKWLPAWWLKMTEIYPPTVLEVRSLKSISLDQTQDVSRTILPLDPLGERSFLTSSSFWYLLAFPGLWHVIPSSISLLMLPSLLSVSNFPGAYPDNPKWSLYLKTLDLITCGKTPVLYYIR